jgi:hypothetical protein
MECISRIYTTITAITTIYTTVSRMSSRSGAVSRMSCVVTTLDAAVKTPRALVTVAIRKNRVIVDTGSTVTD